MQDQRDDHIACADCGTSFLFSAGEAQVFAQRGLASPKRCKECRRARKERAGEGGGGSFARPSQPGSRGPAHSPNAPNAGAWNGAGRDAGPPRGAPGRGGPPHRGAPRYTGDVNEYRSPMQDRSFTAPPWQAAQPAGGDQAFNRPPAAARLRGARPSRQGGPGVYRDSGEYRAPSSHGDGQSSFARAQGAAPGQGGQAGSSRRKPQAEMFSITCNSCGGKAEVPFKPAEGREVFCPSCYRARKPA